MPTYDEADNLRCIVGDVLDLELSPEILVVDDNSPDGTGRIADELAESTGRVRVLHRPGKQGLGAAYRAGLGAALDAGYQVICQMDADGSHRVEDLPALVEVANRGEAAIGSRRVEGGGSVDWAHNRVGLSVLATKWSNLILRTDVRDMTSGFRAWPAEALRKIDIRSTQSRGYAFQIETLVRAQDAGFAIAEVPITFLERTHGTSKLDKQIIAEALWKTTYWGVSRQLGKRRR